MAFLSLGLNIEEPKSQEASQNAPKELSEDILSNGPALVDGKETQERLVSPDKAPHNGTNGAAPKTDPGPIEPEKDNWPEMGMQIIQSVLREAQNKEAGASSERSSEEISDLPFIEELRKKILEGVIPDFRVAPKNGQPRNASSSATSPQTDSAKKLGESSTPLSPDFLSSVMDDLRKHVGEDVLAPLNPPLQADVEPTPKSMSTSAPQSSVTTIPDSLLRALEETRQHLAAPAPPSLLVSERPSSLRTAAPTTQRRTDAIPKFTTFKFGYLPGRGLLYSIIGHEVAMFGLFLLITYGLPVFRAQTLIVGSQSAQSHLIYLPEVGGGTEGQKSPGGGRSKPQQASAAPARASKGFAYPGAQAILSDPPNPTNAFQTLLRPLMVHPEPLKKLVPLPNIVQMAETRLPSSLIAPKTAPPQPRLAVQPIKVKRDSDLRRNAKWNVPVKAPELLAKAEMPKLPAAEQPLPEAPKIEPKKPEELKKEEQKPVEKPVQQPLKVAAEKKLEKSEKQVAPPSTAQIAKMEMHGRAAEPMLSLSPMPLPANSNAKIPSGEARGRFAVAPSGTLNPNSVTPGKVNGTRSASPATGQDNPQSANAATELAANTGNGTGHNPAAGGGSGNANETAGGGSAGTGNGSGSTSGAGVGGAGTGNGRGSSDTGAGRSGHGAGTGAGAGSGAGSGAFPGITIQGEQGESASASNSPGMTVSPQTPYQITIVATASSGGGLQDFGVFENERVYTVYIPMQRTPQDADPTWTLQYSLAPGSSSSGDGQLIAPSPVMREWPQIPADLEKKYAQGQVVVYALLGADGKLSHISVKQTPDPHVSAPIAQALSKWVFRPAQMNNQPVAVKILMGIPL